MIVAELIEKLQKFGLDKQVKLEITDDYRDHRFDMTDDDIFFDDHEDAVVFDGTSLSAW